MSKLDELIAEMCPDGVQSKKITNLFRKEILSVLFQKDL